MSLKGFKIGVNINITNNSQIMEDNKWKVLRLTEKTCIYIIKCEVVWYNMKI